MFPCMSIRPQEVRSWPASLNLEFTIHLTSSRIEAHDSGILIPSCSRSQRRPAEPGSGGRRGNQRWGIKHFCERLHQRGIGTKGGRYGGSTERRAEGGS